MDERRARALNGVWNLMLDNWEELETDAHYSFLGAIFEDTHHSGIQYTFLFKIKQPLLKRHPEDVN